MVATRCNGDVYSVAYVTDVFGLCLCLSSVHRSLQCANGTCVAFNPALRTECSFPLFRSFVLRGPSDEEMHLISFSVFVMCRVLPTCRADCMSMCLFTLWCTLHRCWPCGCVLAAPCLLGVCMRQLVRCSEGLAWSQNKPDPVYLITHKAVNGLRSSGLARVTHLSNIFQEFGLHPSPIKPTIFVGKVYSKSKEYRSQVICYVDDLLVFSESTNTNKS